MCCNGGLQVKEDVMLGNGRKEIEAKMSSVFAGEIGNLSTELQEILIDDMVTAFENRLKVLISANQ